MFPLYQASGFYYAPVSKALVGGSALASIALNFPMGHLRSWFTFSYATLFEEHDILRYLCCRCVFLDPKDILCAGVILYHFRIFERRFGSLKFASYIFCTFCLSLVFELGLLYMLHNWDVSLDPFPTGPYGIVFSLYIAYFCDIPRVAYTHVMGIPVTGKSLTYIIGLQLLSGSLESLLLAFIGLCSGLLVRYNILWIRGWLRFPRFVGKLSDITLGRLLYTPKPTEPDMPMGATLEIQRQQQIERLEQQMAWAQLQPRQQGMFGFGLFGNRWQNRNGPQVVPAAQRNPTPPQLPSDDQVQRLVEMGFNRDNVLNALQATNNDITAATNILLHEA